MADKQSAKRLEAIAYHEAGHAVAALLHEVDIEYVSIVEGADHLAMCLCRPEDINADDSSPETRTRLEAHIMVDFAGQLAEKLFAGTFDPDGCEADDHRAADLADLCCKSPAEAKAFLVWLKTKINDELSMERNWHCVTVIAKALLAEEYIKGDRADQIYREAWQSFNRQNGA